MNHSFNSQTITVLQMVDEKYKKGDRRDDYTFKRQLLLGSSEKCPFLRLPMDLKSGNVMLYLLSNVNKHLS